MKDARWYVPFQYKLTGLVSLIVFVLLGGTFAVLQRYIEQNAVENIKENLQSTTLMVSRLLEDRQARLSEIAGGLTGSELLRVILTDPTLDQVTRDDIVETEVLPNYPQVSLLGVTDPDGSVIAFNQAGHALSNSITAQPFFQTTLDGEMSNGFLIDGRQLLQLTAIPFTIGDLDAPETLGMVIIGIPLSQEDLERIKALSQADLLFLQADRIFLATTLIRLDQSSLSPEEMQELATSSEVAPNAPTLTSIGGERFLSVRVSASGDVPPYIVAKSLDQELAFVNTIRTFMVQFGVASLIAGLVVSYLFARGIAHPIKILQAAAEKVEQGDLTHQVAIRSHDEFSRLGTSFNQMITGLHEKERMRGVMNKVVSKEVADELLKGDLQLGGEERIATILFSDIRGFTTISEILPPKALVDVLNQYFTRVNTVIDAHRGNIDKYIGDAIMALFGAPIAHADDPYQAVLAALGMIDALHLFNQTLSHDLGRTLKIGIGVNTGPLIAGLMGAATRLEYTVMGDTVNLASRLEGLTKHYGVQIIISDATYQAIQTTVPATEPPLRFRALDTVQVKGKTTGVPIYQVFARNEQPTNLGVLLARFQAARQLLEAGEFEKSVRQFTALLNDWPDDPVTQVFLDRAAAYLNDPALYQQSYREGVYIFTEK